MWLLTRRGREGATDQKWWGTLWDLEGLGGGVLCVVSVRLWRRGVVCVVVAGGEFVVVFVVVAAGKKG